MRSRALPAFVVLAVAVAATGCAKHAGGVALTAPMLAPELWGQLEPGGFAVRIDTLMRRAPAKDGWAAGNRPVQVTIWSPARFAGEPMTYRDYVALTANQASLVPASAAGSAAAVGALKRFVVAAGSTAESVERWLDMPVAASWSAMPADRRFPLVVIAQGNYHSAYNQAVLAEYLASHGYVVATSASPLVLEETPDSTSLMTRARRQAADIEYVVDLIRRRSDVDSTRVGIVAHSFGARAAFVAVADGAPARSFVSLDGGIANKLGSDWLDRTSLDSAQLSIPLLHLYQDKDETVQPDFSRVRRWHGSNRTLVRVDEMYHPYFTSLGFVAAADTGLHVAPTVSDLGAKVAGVVQMTGAFLDATLKRKAATASLPAASITPFSVEQIAVGQ